MNFKREGNTVEVLKQSFRADLKRKIGSWKAEMREQENYLSSTSCFWPHFCFCPTCVTCVCAYTYWSYSVSVHRSVRRLWVMLMSGSRVVISEPQAGRPEAAEQLVIWCGLRYRSLGVKLRERETRRHAAATCVQKAMRLWCLIPWEMNRTCYSFRHDVMTETGFSYWLI